MNHKTVIVAVKDAERVEVTIRTRTRKGWFSRDESQAEHNKRVDGIAESVATRFHWKNIRVK